MLEAKQKSLDYITFYLLEMSFYFIPLPFYFFTRNRHKSGSPGISFTIHEKTKYTPFLTITRDGFLFVQNKNKRSYFSTKTET